MTALKRVEVDLNTLNSAPVRLIKLGRRCLAATSHEKKSDLSPCRKLPQMMNSVLP